MGNLLAPLRVPLALFVSTCLAGPWQVSEQPELADALARAPEIAFETIPAPTHSVRPEGPWLVPNPDGRSWDVLMWYYPEYGTDTTLYALDLGTGEWRRNPLPDAYCPHLVVPSLHPNGKAYWAAPYRREPRDMHLFVYDPATNTQTMVGKMVPGLAGERFPTVLGPDGRIYGTGGYRDGNTGLYAYDPATGAVQDYGPVGPSHAPSPALPYAMAADDRFIYVNSGMVPWHLLCVDPANGETKVLLTASGEGEGISLAPRAGGGLVRCQETKGGPRKFFHVYHGELHPAGDDGSAPPPWPAARTPYDRAAPRPQIYDGERDPDADGMAALWWRAGDDAPWIRFSYGPVETYPAVVRHFTPLPDGRVFASGIGRTHRFLYDPATGKSQRLGWNNALEAYVFLPHGGRIYGTGYPFGSVFVYDPARPWTVDKPRPPGEREPGNRSPESNPRMVGRFYDLNHLNQANSGLMMEDGTLYVAGIGLRNYFGGSFGWIDTKTEQMDGLWKPFSGHPIFWLQKRKDRAEVMIGTGVGNDILNDRKRPAEARIFVFDHATKKIVRSFAPIKGATATGPFVEVAPGRFLALTRDPENAAGGLLYGFDGDTGAVLFTKKIPVGPTLYWGHLSAHWDFKLGPDGHIWTFLGRRTQSPGHETLVRIDPKDATVKVVGRMTENAAGAITFLGADAWFTGARELRRLRGIVTSTSPDPFRGSQL